MDWQDKIISVYLFICEEYKKHLYSYCERFTNYANLSFSDEEVMTIYLCASMEGKVNKRQIYTHAENYWTELFPTLPSYVAFVQRLNKLDDVFIELSKRIQAKLPLEMFSINNARLIDSMPIIMAQNNRRFFAKVAPDLADKGGYCATKKLHYYGVKLHIMGSAQIGSIPAPEVIGLTPAGMHDIKAYEQILPETIQYEKFADKAYCGDITYQTNTYTPVKKDKGQEFLDAADQLYSRAVSKIRQPIESLFNWIEEKVNIQMASKVRSYSGLIVHVFAKLAAALILFVDRFSS